MSNPKFSIILPTHNGEDRVHHAVHSIKSQSYKDWELIVVLDSCTDDSKKAVENVFIDDLKELDKVTFIETNVHRDGLARNAGLDAATGDWILFIDDDDMFLHEYCLELLSNQVGKNNEDVLDFSFIWKNVGYREPTPDEQFVMVWCRAWRRSFIGQERFNADAYGSDKEFYQRMIQDNENVVITFWHCPIYYYNYMREGSLSWMEKQKKTLDIIITHHDEPWEYGRPLFDSLQHQRCVDLSDIRVTLVQDGEEGDLDWNDLLDKYSYPVSIITTEHLGVSAARNKALEHTTAPWVMFMNFDDFLGDACSLSMMLENFPNDDYDVVWSKMVQEQKWFTGVVYLNRIDGVSYATVSGKMYRRSMLDKNNIRFDEDSVYYYDHIFNSLVLASVEPFRIAALTTEFYPYFKTFRADSTRHTQDAFMYAIKNAVNRDIRIAELLKQRGYEHEAERTALKAVLREYYAICNPDSGENSVADQECWNGLLGDTIDKARGMSLADIEPVQSEAEIEVMNLIQEYYNEHKKEFYLVNDDKTFEEWLSQFGSTSTVTSPDDVQEEQAQEIVPDTDDERNARVVVYCGTFDVYLNMVASLKSVLCSMPVDKVYFLIEDDEFPYELPDIVQCINVKNQTVFPREGPNFNNSWTWMCMMRAVYPNLFEQYDRVLSLDIDIVMNDNVSDLWDYDISDYYMAGVPERQRQKTSSDPLYINFGVVLMNLKKMREDNKQEEIINLLNTQKIDCPEQGAFNRACAGHILGIPADYNYTTYSHITGDAQKQRIIHYAGQKFWRHYKLVKQYSDLDWNDVMNKQNELKVGDTNG